MNIKVDSYVKYKVNGKVGFGKVRFKTGDIYVVQNDKGRTINLNVNNDFIEVIKPIIFDSEKIRKFVRCEDIDFSKNIMNYSIKRGTIRNFTIEDIYVGLENIF